MILIVVIIEALIVSKMKMDNKLVLRFCNKNHYIYKTGCADIGSKFEPYNAILRVWRRLLLAAQILGVKIHIKTADCS